VSNQYPSLAEVTCVGIDDVAGDEFDLVVATWWHTVYSLPRLVAPRYAQFVQNLEDRFYTSSAVAARAGAAAAQTLPITYITTAGWLEKQLRLLRPGARIYCVRSGVDKEVFRPNTSIVATTDGPLRIAIEGPGGVWFKAVKDALDAVQRVREPRHITVLASDTPTDEIRALADRVEVRLSHLQMADVFRNVDVLLKLSRLEGMAAPPLEAFHCGATAVMTPVTGSDEYGEHGVNCMIVGYDDMIGTARTLDLLARDRRFLGRLRTNALATAEQWPTWQQATAALNAVLAEIAESPPVADAGDARQLTLETYAMYLRLETMEQRLAASLGPLPGIAGRVLRLWQREGATGVRARVAQQVRTLRSHPRGFRGDPLDVDGKDAIDEALAEGKFEDKHDSLEEAATRGDASQQPVLLDDESREIFLHAYMPREGDIIVDAGAGHGTEVLTFSRLVGQSGKVIAVEAHPEAVNELRKLCDREELGNVELVHAALAATSGVTRISDLEEPVFNSTVTVMNNGISVPATTLDEVLRGLGIADIDLLKMNIEGAEVEALEGFTQGIRRTRHVCIACHDFLADRDGAEQMRTRESVRGLLERAGFNVTSQSHELPWIADYLYGAIG
jgi:FkbM family methyltransferase